MCMDTSKVVPLIPGHSHLPVISFSFLCQEKFREYLALSKRFLLKCEENGTVDLLPVVRMMYAIVARALVLLATVIPGRCWSVVISPLGVAGAATAAAVGDPRGSESSSVRVITILRRRFLCPAVAQSNSCANATVVLSGSRQGAVMCAVRNLPPRASPGQKPSSVLNLLPLRAPVLFSNRSRNRGSLRPYGTETRSGYSKVM